MQIKKVEAIISAHVEHRKSERLSHPSRFDIKKSIAERCVQRPVPEIPKGSVESGYDFYNQNNSDVAGNIKILNSSYHIRIFSFFVIKLS